MPYELNPLLRDELQKKSPVTPSDIQRIESEIYELKNNLGNLNQKKITKFFSAYDSLENDEVAEYQGYGDGDNNLVTNFFYKKNPELTVNVTSTLKSISMLDFFAYDFLNNQILIQKFTADRTLTENIFITGNFDNSDNETVGLFLIAANTTNQFGTRWITLPDNRRIAPFAFFVENNSIVARYVDIDYDDSNFFIDGEEFYFKNQTIGNYSQISFNLPNNCFYYWIYCTLNRIPFYFPVACASSDYSTADLIFVSEIPLIASRLRFVQPAVLMQYYDYTASINPILFTRVNTQPLGVTPEEAQELVSNRVINAGGVATIIALTQAAYDAITTKDANTMYVITD